MCVRKLKTLMPQVYAWSPWGLTLQASPIGTSMVHGAYISPSLSLSLSIQDIYIYIQARLKLELSSQHVNPSHYRLYRESPKTATDKKKRDKDKEKKRRKKDKKKKKKKSRHHSISSADEEDHSVTTCMSSKSSWSVACLTLQDWEKLTEKYKNSKAKMDRELFETLSESFLPEIVKMFAEKEREERRRMLMLQPKRASSRIERKRKEQEDRDRQLAMQVN